MSNFKKFALSSCIGLGMLSTAIVPAFAQETGDMTQFVTEDVINAPAEEDDSKLRFTLSTNASAALASNKDVVGEVDGFSTLFGLGISAGLEYMVGAHAWTNTLSISESWARTPTIEQFVKNNDQIQFESLYNYFLLDWFGPFARFHMETSLFDTTAVTAEAQDYSIERLSGAVDNTTTDSIRLAKAFEPLTFSESIGVFAEPVRSTPLTWKIRLGAGARETLAKGVLATQDDDATSVIELIELDDVYQAGLEGFMGVEGKFDSGRFAYYAGFSGLLPIFNNDDADRSAVDLLRWGLRAGLNMSVTEWMGLNYSLNLLKDPQLLDSTQVQNNLLLTFKYNFFEEEEELTLAEAAEQYRKKADEADKEAAKYREKAIDAEKKMGDEAKQNREEEAQRLQEQREREQEALEERQKQLEEEEKRQQEEQSAPDTEPAGEDDDAS